MTKPDATQAHEQACLEATRSLLEAYKSFLGRKVVTDVRLEGARPDTEIVVRWHWRGQESEEREQRFAFWRSDFAEADGSPGRPPGVASIIFANVDEET